MTVEELYSNVFQISGGIDDNNKYINLESDKINTIQLLEPTIGVTEFVVTQKDRVIQNNLPDRMAFRLPVVSINEQMIRNELITGFYVDYSSFVPSMMVEFVDMNNEMLSTNSLQDGSIIKIYIGGNGDELYYKPIRQDFIVTNIMKLNSGDQNQGEWIHYRINGILNVPMGHRKEAWSNYQCTSTQELFNLSIYTGLGFATNFTFTPIDTMKWENKEGTTFFDFMRDIATHACYSPNTFFTAFVDQYYVLNFVECHSLLSHGGKKTDTPAMIYCNIQDDKEPKVNKIQNGGKNTKTTDQIKVDKSKNESDLMNDSQKLSCYFLTNYHYYKGWSNFIESYSEISDGYSSVNEGYRKNIIYSDSNSSGGSIIKFSIPPIDNLERDSTTQQIKSLNDNITQDTYIPINLIQLNNIEYQSTENEVDKLNGVESLMNYGEVDTSNLYNLYYFSEIQNEYQMSCMKKCGLRVVLQNYNPAITKFSRIWVDLFDMNPTSSSEIKKTKEDTSNGTKWSEYIKTKNKNIIQYEDEGVMNTGNENNKKDKKNINFPRGNYNRSLSGWYVVTEFKIVFDNYDKNLKTHLVLNRIEHKPLYKDEFTTAKKAVEKYKEENRIELIYQNLDDFSYSDSTDDISTDDTSNTSTNIDDNKTSK